ncbi:hypothetical protein HF086_002893 [Spodoptera exigua]|uniref:DDE-1 domain-containing protein n=1 Tax=Spodoptera exigua TaxID=7107 RepID=A0A922M951_SPOEX|nr:hypothetical protein HF086_002893 [Spodoptera exigua]
MPPEWCLGRSETGWMRGDVFFEYITNDFHKWVVENNIKKPVLLLVDGHKSHMSLMLSEMCEKLEIILYALPPNTTHILQPADVSVLAPVKTYWKSTVRAFLSKPKNLNSVVTKTNFCTLLNYALKHPNMPDNIKNGFRRCGLYPFDANSPDYTKCVRNTLENVQAVDQQSKVFTYLDIKSFKKVLKHLKPTLKEKNIDIRTIKKEVNRLKKSLPAKIVLFLVLLIANWMQLKKSQSLHFKKTLKPKMMELTPILLYKFKQYQPKYILHLHQNKLPNLARQK